MGFISFSLLLYFGKCARTEIKYDCYIKDEEATNGFPGVSSKKKVGYDNSQLCEDFRVIRLGLTEQRRWRRDRVKGKLIEEAARVDTF